MTFSSFAKFLWPLATATAQSLGPVPPPLFALRHFLQRSKHADVCNQQLSNGTLQPAPGIRRRGARGHMLLAHARGALEGAGAVDVASLWGTVGQFGHTLFNCYLYERYTTYSCTKTFFKPSTKHDPIDPSRHVIRLLALFAITPRNTPLGTPRQNFR